MVRNREIEEVVEMPCPCNDNDIVNNLKDQIEKDIIPRLQSLNIFDTQNVFVCCLDLQIANNSISITNLNNPSSCINSSGQQFGHRQIVSSAGVYVVVGNSCKLGCDKRSNIIYIGNSGDLGRRIGNDFIVTLQSGNNQHSGAQKIREAILINNITQTCLYVIGFPLNDKFVEDKKEDIIKKLFNTRVEFEELANEKIEEKIKRGIKDFLKKILEETLEKLLSLSEEEEKIQEVIRKLQELQKNEENIKNVIEKLKEEVRNSEISNLEALLKILLEATGAISESEEIKEMLEKVEKVFKDTVEKLLLMEILPEKVEGCFQADYRHFYLIDPCFVDQTEDPDFNIFLIPPYEARRTIKFILTTIDIFFRDCIQNC